MPRTSRNIAGGIVALPSPNKKMAEAPRQQALPITLLALFMTDRQRVPDAMIIPGHAALSIIAKLFRGVMKNVAKYATDRKGPDGIFEASKFGGRC